MRTAEGILSQVSRYAQSPALLRCVSHLMRRTSPVLRLGNAVFVFDYNDVLDTLASDADFGVTPVYAYEMGRTSGDFFLGMESGPRYTREHEFASQAYRPEDAERIKALVTHKAQQVLQSGTGTIDFVRDIADAIPLALLGDYFGVPGPNPDLMLKWMRILFWDLFLNLVGDRRISRQAVDVGVQLRPYLEQRVAEIRAKGGEDTFLGRLVAQQAKSAEIAEDAIYRNIGGIAIGAMATQAKAMTLALQELLKRPEILQQAQQAARDGNDELLSGYIFEALRFNPHNPLVVRYAMRPTRVAPNTTHETAVDTGTQIFVMTISASFDAKGFANPETFDPRRPYDDYLHFSYGMHRCFGVRMVKVVLTAALGEVLRLGTVRSVKAPRRAVAYAGPFPTSMRLQYYPAQGGRGSRVWSFAGISERYLDVHAAS